ncbi:MAG: hypothetical protein JEY94_10215 [Melioribacteraceae bacterium]|nr:hypothetical protein [Melioribacteraceae bacterium]
MNSFQDLIKSAAAFEDNGKFFHALQFYDKASKEDPNNKLLIVKKAALYEKIDRLDSAIKFMDSFIESESYDDDIILFYGQFLIRNFEFEKAVDVLALTSSDEKLASTFLIGLSYFNLKDFGIAKIKFEDFVENNKSSDLLPEAYLYLAKTNIELGKDNEALDNLKNSEKLSGMNWELYLIFAKIYYLKEMYLHAKDSLEKASRLNGDKNLIEELSNMLTQKIEGNVK